MKYTKIFMALLMALFMVACSDDDDAINTNQITLGFENEAIVVKENVGYFNVPIKIAGYRNGNVKVNVVATPVGENGAVEDVNYMITDKSVQLLSENDTTDNATLNIQIKTIDDQEINENRSFTLEITSAEGATITTKTIQITLRDNDAAFYEKFFGKWDMTCTNHLGNTVKYDVVISGPTDEDDPDYENYLYVTISKIVSGLTANTYFKYSFDKATRKGKLAFDLEDTAYPIASYAAYNAKWVWVNFDPQGALLEDPIDAEWTIDENSAIPTTLEFNTYGGTLATYEFFSQNPDYAGIWGYYNNIVLTRK